MPCTENANPSTLFASQCFSAKYLYIKLRSGKVLEHQIGFECTQKTDFRSFFTSNMPCSARLGDCRYFAKELQKVTQEAVKRQTSIVWTGKCPNALPAQSTSWYRIRSPERVCSPCACRPLTKLGYQGLHIEGCTLMPVQVMQRSVTMLTIHRTEGS